MAVRTEKELNEMQRSHWLKAIAAIELRNFGYAISLLQGILRQEPEFLTGRRLLRRTEVTKKQIGQEKPFQHLDRADRGHESSARDKKRSKARSGNDRKDIGGRAIPSPGESGIEGSGGGGGLAGGRHFCVAHLARRKSARRESAARARPSASRSWAKRS